MIYLETCEVLSEVSIDEYHFKVTLTPDHEGSCILWFRDDRVQPRFRALGRFSFFEKAKVLQFIVRYTTNPDLRKDIDHRKFENRLERLTTISFDHFEKMSSFQRLRAGREIFDLDGYFDKADLIRRRKIMAKKFHPDRGGDSHSMSIINQAYEFLLPHAVNR